LNALHDNLHSIDYEVVRREARALKSMVRPLILR
jgi:hypothetical protein